VTVTRIGHAAHIGQPLGMFGVHHAGGGGAEWVAKNPVDANAHQADTDDRNDGARDHRRKEAQHAADYGRDQDGDDTLHQ
jgi:hypothetical protein